MRKSRLSLLIASLVITVAAGFPPVVAHADAAPPLVALGGSLESGQGTKVQMYSEKVEMDARDLAREDGKIAITARFRMRNTGSEEEHLTVRFPVEFPGEAPPAPVAEGLTVEINSAPSRTNEIVEPLTLTDGLGQIRWASFDVTFPPERDVIITVRYTIRPIGYFFGTRLQYVLQTGGGWEGPIELVQIVVRLPYDTSWSNYLGQMSPSTWWRPLTMSGDTMTWTKWHLEPTGDDNFDGLFVRPWLWSSILEFERRIANGEASPEDYLTLAHQYWTAAVDDFNYVTLPRLANAAEAAIRRGRVSSPWSVDLIAEGAYYRWMRLTHSNSITAGEFDELQRLKAARIRCQLEGALAIDPSNRRANELATLMQTARVSQGNCPP